MILFCSSLNVVDLNYHCYLCVFISLWVFEFILFEGISLHDPLLLYGVCMFVCEWTCKTRSRLFFSLLLKGSLDFGFIYLKNLFLSFFPSYNYLLCFFYSLLSARTLIKHTLSAWKTLNSLLFITQWSSRHHLYYTAFSECNCLKIECCFVVVVVYVCLCE